MKTAGEEYASAEYGVVIEVNRRWSDRDQMGMQKQRGCSKDYCSGDQQRLQRCTVPDLHDVEAPVLLRWNESLSPLARLVLSDRRGSRANPRC